MLNVFFQLPETQHIAKIKLIDKATGDDVGIIENKPGSAGSVRVYSYLMDIFGAFTYLVSKASAIYLIAITIYLAGVEITRQAANLALAIYAEHVDDAHANPGKHGNIDRLIRIASTGDVVVGELVEQDQ